MMVTFFALFSGIVLAELMMPVFNDFVHAGVAPDYLKESWKLIDLCHLSRDFSGSYPAFYVSSFQPANVLKGRSGSVKGGIGLKKCLWYFNLR